jgi:gliding motility-associated-like protein
MVPGLHPVRLTVVDKNYCSDILNRQISYFPAPATVIVQPSSFVGCIPGEITFDNQSFPLDESYQIEWDFGDGDTALNVISPTHVYTVPGWYTVRLAITSPIGCFVADTFENLIRVVPSPVADFTFSPSQVTNLEPEVTFTDLSKEVERWFWRFDRYGTSNDQNPVFSFPDTGLMRVLLVVTHPEGCKDTLVKFIDVLPEIRWFMPNAFTPNGDGSNEGFLGKGFLLGASDFTMTIWNRWGELVFETKDPNEAWNGRAQQSGGVSPAGVYVYRVTFTGPRGQQFEYKGFATLVR